MKLNTQYRQTIMPEVTKACIPRIKSAKSKHGISLASLRPHDRLESEFGSQFTVIQNSAKLQKLECFNERLKRSTVFDYIYLDPAIYTITYLGGKLPLTRWQKFLKLLGL